MLENIYTVCSSLLSRDLIIEKQKVLTLLKDGSKKQAWYIFHGKTHIVSLDTYSLPKQIHITLQLQLP